MKWFEKRCSQGRRLSVLKCSHDTGIPRSTIREYIDAHDKYIKGEYDNWWLEMVGEAYGYNVTWIGRPHEKIWVTKQNPTAKPSAPYIDPDDDI